MIIALPVNVDPEVMSMSAEAHVALTRGETARAAELRRQAGELLEKQIGAARKQADKHFLRFLAATQYYKGGLYPKARKVSDEIQARLLPSEARPLLDQFLRDVHERSRPDYAKKVRRRIRQALESGKFAKIIEIFQDHPYVLPQGGMAVLRAWCCERLKDYRGAALFFEDAFKFEPENVEVVLTAASYPHRLMNELGLAETWEYVRRQIATIRHPLPHIIASIVRFHQASQVSGQERRELTLEQIEYYRAAWELFQEIPDLQQRHPAMREYMALSLEGAVLGMMYLGDSQGALETASRAVTFSPTSYSAWTIRGVVTYPSESALRDFRQAALLGDANYFPYYYLAHAAFASDNLAEAIEWCERALRHHPRTTIQSQLLEMLAIARSRLGARPEEVEHLFAAAQQLDPDNARIRYNLRVFRNGLNNAESAQKQEWDRDGLQDGASLEQVFAEYENLFLQKKRDLEPELQEMVSGG